jgi:hypothetical protein
MFHLFGRSKPRNQDSNAQTRLSAVQVLKDLLPVKAVTGETALNKAGRLVLKGFHGERPVKVFEAATRKHAEYIAAISRHRDLGSLFPPVLDLCGTFVVAEWIDGVSMHDVAAASGEAKLTELMKVQQQLYKTPLAGLPELDFDYWRDVLWPRFERFAPLLDAAGVVESVRSRAESGFSFQPGTVLHPDLTLKNIVIQNDGNLRIIDNDVLSAGRCHLLDMCNTAYTLPAEPREAHVSQFLATMQMELCVAADAAEAIWLVRMVGSHCLAGRIDAARTILAEYGKATSILPFKILN